MTRLQALLTYDVKTDSFVKITPEILDRLECAQAWLGRFATAAKNGEDCSKVWESFDAWRVSNWGVDGLTPPPFPLLPLPSMSVPS